MRPGTCVIGGFLVIGIVFRCGMTAAADPPVGPRPIAQAADSSAVTAKPAGNVHTAPEGEIPVPPPQEAARVPEAAHSPQVPPPSSDVPVLTTEEPSPAGEQPAPAPEQPVPSPAETTPLSEPVKELPNAEPAPAVSPENPVTLPPQSTPEAAASEATEATDKKPERKPDRARYAAVDLSDVDEDFAFQGEYVGGSLRRRGGGFGLQVVALGDGRFDAALLAGGLPGDGWDGVTRHVLTGQRSGDWVTLEGDGYRAELSAEQARLANSEGGSLAEMHKVRRVSPREGTQPPRGALVLFNGTTSDAFEKAEMSGDGLLSAGALTKLAVQDFHLHLEFRTPYMPYARDQGRGNSGVYIQQRYEVQILDSFGLTGEPNQCGGLYRQQPPDINMCYPPLVWQTYDIYFRAARWDGQGNKIRNALITVVHNGQPIHWDYSIPAKTGAGKAEGPQAMPILLQDHGNPVHFRNVWIDVYEPVTERVVWRSSRCATRFVKTVHRCRLLSRRRCR